ncbi:MAG: hypothetical protein OXH23_04240 [bacterium]|nr:hypothetical protein [bacterium]
MTILHGRQGQVWAGTYDLTGFFQSFDVAVSTDANETTTFGARDRTFIKGLATGTMSFGGLWDDSVRGSDEALEDLRNDSAIIATAVLGDSHTYTGTAIATGVTVTSPFADVTRVSLDVQLADQVADQDRPLLALGRVLLAGSPAAASGNGDVIDFGAHPDGFAWVLHVDTPPASGATLLVQTSATANFASSATVDQVTLAANTRTATIETDSSALNRYVRLAWTNLSTSSKLLAAIYKT